MKARGKREARRPWSNTPNAGQGLKGCNTYYALFQGCFKFLFRYQGRRASRLRLAIIFRTSALNLLEWSRSISGIK
jgi:hypothetical protein